MLAPAAASSLDKPNAIAAQNLLSPSRPATGGRPGEGNGALPERSERRRFNLVIVTPHEALRRPLESALQRHVQSNIVIHRRSPIVARPHEAGPIRFWRADSLAFV